MNGYVTGGWSVTAGFLALYTWRLMHRGRLLTQALPPAEDHVAVSVPEETPPASDTSVRRASSGPKGEARAWP